jgi:hypothetical protein
MMALPRGHTGNFAYEASTPEPEYYLEASPYCEKQIIGVIRELHLCTDAKMDENNSAN